MARERVACEFGFRLQEAMRTHKITSKVLAKVSGVSVTTVYAWRRGCCYPSVPILNLILEALPDTDARWLVCGKTSSTSIRVEQLGTCTACQKTVIMPRRSK